MTFGIDPEVITVAHLIGRERQGTVEYTEQSVDGIHGYLPYTEESEHMVYAVSVEVFCHLAETSLPPGESVL